jgi:hypothetical protein
MENRCDVSSRALSDGYGVLKGATAACERWPGRVEEAIEVNWKRRYSEEAEEQLDRLSRAVELVSHLVSDARSCDNVPYADDVSRFREICGTIRDELDELGWVEPEAWLPLAVRIDRELKRLRQALDQSADWFALGGSRQPETVHGQSR